MAKWRGVLGSLVFFLMFLSGLFSGNVVTMVIGAALTFAYTSVFLTSYVESEHRLKKDLEVVSAILALSIIVYGYVLTESFILGVITLLIVVMFFVAFTLSYLLPKIRNKSSGYSQNHLKEE
jgi:hypothetical protein